MRRNDEPVKVIAKTIDENDKIPFLLGKTKQTSKDVDDLFSLTERDQVIQDPIVILNQEQSNLFDNNQNTGPFDDKEIQETSVFCSDLPEVAESRLLNAEKESNEEPLNVDKNLPAVEVLEKNCSICYEIMVEPITLSACSHRFCAYCLQRHTYRN